MSNKKDAIKEFGQYAEEKLKNHMAELNTRYENEKPGKEVLQQAYLAHREIFNKELDEKIQSLLSVESNKDLKENLENVKESYLSKLQLENQ